MPLTTIASSKDVTPQLLGIPLVLVEVQLIDGSHQYFSTHPLNTTEGSSSYTYLGNAYFARVSQQVFSAIQARSEQGIDRVDTITLTMADSDRVLLAIEKSLGFAGAILTLRLVMWQADTSTFTSDSRIPFLGIANGPTYDRDQSGKGDALTLTATSGHNDARIDLPLWQVQYTCGNDFPVNAAERLAGASDISHHCWSCGYDPDQAATDPEGGGDARRGNTTTANLTDSYGRKISDSSGNYIWCGKTRSDCTARGMFSTDSSSRVAKRFNGIEWAPINREVSSKSYLDGKTIRFTQLGRNDAVFAERFPMLYTADASDNGGQWVHPVICNIVGDANETRFEFVTCQDYTGIDGSWLVQLVVNGVIVPFFASSPDQKLFFVSQVSNGSRTGGINPVALYDSLGDPYGSLTCGVASIYRQLAEAGSAPNVMALARGPYIKIPNSTDGSSSGQSGWGARQRTSNPVWQLLDVMIWSNWKYTEIDLQSFMDAAPYCDVSISYVNYQGFSSTHKRFRSQFVLEKARKASEVRTGLLNNFGGQLTKDPVTGKATLILRRTLADQQGSPIAGSNYSTAVKSINAAGTVTNGYVAFKFDESTILKDAPDAVPHLRWSIVPFSSGANEIRFGFQNEENSFSQDRITVKDPDAINRAGGYQSSQEIPLDYNIIGVPNFDQAFRRGNVILAEKNRGNPRLDAGGTMMFGPFAVSGIRIAHLRAGDICLLQWQAYGLQPATQLQSPSGTPISGILVRVQEINWDINYQRANVTVIWHEDVWYTDLYGQQGPPAYSNPRAGIPGRPPLPWQPYGVQPISGDSVFGIPPGGYTARSWWGFGVAQSYGVDSNGNPYPILAVSGCPPVNQLTTNQSSPVQPPLVGIQGSSSGSGGSIPAGQTFFFAVAAKDSNGILTPLSAIWQVTTPTGGGATCSITSPTIYWQSGSTGYVLYGGPDSNNLSEQDNQNSTPSTITLTALNYETYGPPDPLADSLHFVEKKVVHGGRFGDVAIAVSTNTLQFAEAASYSTDEYAGCDLELVAMPRSGADASILIHIANFRVSANDTSGNLTVSPDPMTAMPDGSAIPVGCVFVCLPKPDTFSATTIGDSGFVNGYAPTGLTVNEGNFGIRITSGTGMGQIRTIESNTDTVYTITQAWDTIPDATSRFIVFDPTSVQETDVERIVNASPTTQQTWYFNAGINFKNQTILLQVQVQDAQGNWSLEPFAPLRMIWIWGEAGDGGAALITAARAD